MNCEKYCKGQIGGRIRVNQRYRICIDCKYRIACDYSESFIQDPDSAKIDSAGKKRVERRSDIINDLRGLYYFINLHWSEDYILQSEYKSHWSNVCRTSRRTVSRIIFFGHWSNICTYLLDTESICKRVCICYNFVRTFGSRILSLFSKRQVEIYGSVPVSMFCGNL